MLSNVAATSSEDATSGLTAIIKGFSLDADDAMSVADKLVKVGQSYAISASELMQALERGGAALFAGGNTLDESIAILAAGNAAVQNAESVGTAMKTLSARIRGSKAELDELGEEYDDVALSSSKYRAEIKALSGVDIMENDSTYKSTYQILREIAEVYDDISDIDKATLLEDLGGKRNISVLTSIITNLKDLTGAYDAAANSSGTASKANDIYMDTVQAKINVLKESFEEFSKKLLSSDLLKTVVGALDKILNGFLTPVLTSLNNLPLRLIIISTALGTIFGVINKIRALVVGFKASKLFKTFMVGFKGSEAAGRSFFSKTVAGFKEMEVSANAALGIIGFIIIAFTTLSSIVDSLTSDNGWYKNIESTKKKYLS